jgi:pyruvate,water dikinase
MTDVGVVPAMRRAAAIITDVGGVTCHAAIVAREFGIPCVIGTKVGTKVLKNGYLVDVNTGIFDLLDRG